MASAFDDDKDASGTRSSVFDDIDRQRGINPAPASETTEKRGWKGVAGDVLQTVDDAVRATADTLTFGLLDRALGEEEIKKTTEARKRSPYATVGGDIAGAVATPGVGVVGGAIARGLGGARAGLAGGLGRAAGYGVEGAGYGAAQAAGHTYDWENLPHNLAVGGGIGAAGGALTGPLARVAPVPRAAVPSTDETLARATQHYDQFRAAPVQYSPQRINLGADAVEQALIGRGINSTNADAAFRAIDLARTQPRTIGQPGSPASVGTIWEQLSAAQAQGGRDAIAAHAMKNEIRNIITSPTGTVRGTPQNVQQAANDLLTGNANYAGAARARTLESAERDAARGAASTHSGFNYENKVRQAATRLTKENQARDPLMGYTAAERQSVEDLASRSNLPNMTRYVGNLLGGGGGLGALATGGVVGGAAGFGTQDPTTGILAGLGAMGGSAALRSMGNRAMQREVQQATDVLRQRTPLFQERWAANPGMQPGPGHGYSSTRQGIEAGRKAITLEMIRQQMEGEGGRPRITVYGRNPR